MLLVAHDRPSTDPEPPIELTAAAEVHGFCPTCDARVYSRVNTRSESRYYSFVHFPRQGCTDTWKRDGTGGEGEWHRQWKLNAREHGARLEVPLVAGTVRHRTDALGDDGTAIEFQSSPLSDTELAERSNFYSQHAPGRRLVWIFKVKQVDVVEDGWVWPQPRRLPTGTNIIVILDLGDGHLVRCRHITYQGNHAKIYGKTMNRMGVLTSVRKGFEQYRLTKVVHKQQKQPRITQGATPCSSTPAPELQESPPPLLDRPTPTDDPRAAQIHDRPEIQVQEVQPNQPPQPVTTAEQQTRLRPVTMQSSSFPRRRPKSVVPWGIAFGIVVLLILVAVMTLYLWH